MGSERSSFALEPEQVHDSFSGQLFKAAGSALDDRFSFCISTSPFTSKLHKTKLLLIQIISLSKYSQVFKQAAGKLQLEGQQTRDKVT